MHENVNSSQNGLLPPAIRYNRMIIARRQHGTGEWLLKASDYLDWRAGMQSTLLCPGIPGAGKTMMVSIIIDDLWKQFEAHNDIAVVYLYCSFKRQQEQRLVDLLATLVRQLFQERSHLPGTVRSMYQRHVSRNTRPSIDELRDVLRSLTGTYSRVFFVVDALDECTNLDRTCDVLLAELFQLQALSKDSMAILATSRFIPEILDQFRNATRLEIRASEEDVGRYLDGQMPRLASCVMRRAELKEKIKIKIIESVDGMFLLAQLHFDSLIDKTKPRDISQALENLPKGSEALSTAYQEALDRIDSQQPGFRKLAQQVLAWTTYSQRPLTVGELQHALAVEVGTTEIDAENDLEEFSEMVSVCAGLVTIDPESNVIRLVHHTAQNFLEQVREDWLADAQTKIAESCLAYLSLETLADGWCLNDTLFETKLNQNVFLDYAAKYWGTHASHKREPRTKNLALSFLNKEGNTSSAHQVMFSPAYRYSGYSQGGPQKLSAMHLLAHFGLENIASAHLNHGYDPDLRDTDGRTPLSWAAQNGAESVVKLLITRDDVVADSKDNKDRTPLLWAAGYGHKKVAELLLSRNDVIADLKDQYSRTPLLWAAGNGHDVVVQLLLTRNDIVADSKDNNGQTPLLWAARKGAEAVVKLLLAQDDVIVNSKDVYGRTPLSWAAGNRHDVIVKLLLTRNDTIADSKDNNGQTPLSWAAENGAEAALKLLLARDDVVADSKDKYGRTPLLWAAENGHEILVKLLLARDDVIANSKDEYGRTPLLWAAEN